MPWHGESTRVEKTPSYSDDTRGATRNSWCNSSNSQMEPRILGGLPTGLSPGEISGKRGNAKSRNSRFSAPRKTPRPRARGGVPGGPPGDPPRTPQNEMFSEGYFVLFSAVSMNFTLYTPIYPKNGQKRGQKKGFAFVPTGRVIKYPKKCTLRAEISGNFSPEILLPGCLPRSTPKLRPCRSVLGATDPTYGAC